MTAAYHARFADALRGALPAGFTVSADRALATADYGTARLVGYVPAPADQRMPVAPGDVRAWIDREVRTLRRISYHFTPEAKAAAAALLAALDPAPEV